MMVNHLINAMANANELGIKCKQRPKLQL